MLTGLGFKLALAPFHQWAPDAYSGAPTPVLVILAVGTKVAVIAAFVRLLYGAVPGLQSYWGPLVTTVALITVLVGSIGVLLQREMGRLIAYSGIAQIGLVVLALATGTGAGARAAFLNLVAYAAATGALVTVLGMTRRAGSEGRTLPAFGGLMTRHRGIAFALIIALLSLGGIPPTAGFAGKLALLAAALNSVNPWVVFVAALASVVTVAAYVRVFLAILPLGSARQRSRRARSCGRHDSPLLVADACRRHARDDRRRGRPVGDRLVGQTARRRRILNVPRAHHPPGSVQGAVSIMRLMKGAVRERGRPSPARAHRRLQAAFSA